MDQPKLQLYFLLSLLVGTSIVAFFIFRPFLYALILAMVFATIFQPVYQKILGFVQGRQELAALFTILIIVVCIFTPLIFLGMQIFQEAQKLYFSFTNTAGGGNDAVLGIFNGLIDTVKNYFPATQDLFINIDQYIKQSLSWFLQHFGAIFGSLAKTALSFFVFLISLYYLLKDGHRLKKFIVLLSPLTDTDNEVIFKKLGLAINSVVKGNLAIATTQGVLTALGFAIFGVPNAVLWGTVTAITALVPGVGTALVLIPAIIFLYFSSKTSSALGLLLWGAVAVGLIDNFLGPKLVGRGMQLHPLIILLSVLGGMIFFGPLGFLFGPLIVSLFFTFLDIYSSLVINLNNK